MKKVYVQPTCVTCDIEVETVFMEGSINVYSDTQADQWSFPSDEGSDGVSTWHSTLWDEEE
ncbi:MAG: hypothetical protein J6B92_02830 [Paraprevotella sp.]|nr:hypothetical protein [Paraprevotella sp.]